jgi:hypothetical protein
MPWLDCLASLRGPAWRPDGYAPGVEAVDQAVRIDPFREEASGPRALDRMQLLRARLRGESPRIGVDGSSTRNRRVASIPSMSGIETSIRITSGCNACA